jgi:hypothetical protein
MQYVLVNNQDEIRQIRDFGQTVPDMLPELKGLTWLQYTETRTEISATEKYEGETVTVDRDAGTVEKVHLKVDKTDEENIDHAMTPPQMMTMCAYVAQRGQTIYTVAWAHKDAIELIETMAELEAYDLAGGRPE